MNLVSLWGGGFGLPETVALGAVAVLGYLFGCRRDRQTPSLDKQAELAKAAAIARELESVLIELRSDLASHRHDVERFKQSVYTSGGEDDQANQRLRDEAERVLTPTLQLVCKVASAYDQIRRQSQALAGFSGGRTDDLTGLCNSRALSELLQLELSGHAATGGQFAVAVFGLHEAGAEESRSEQQAHLLHAIELLRPQLRDTDLLARYGLDELVVVMPHTRLYGACVFGRRVRTVLREAGLTMSCGLAQSNAEDTASSLLGRADSALYSAKATTAGEQFLHNGQSIRRDTQPDVGSVEDQPPLQDAPSDTAEESEKPQAEELAACSD